ncbi:MAG: hypothetical protein JO075_05530 [Acidimicrobiia bacterium]|nr:hypothetical protein [Acidimicrobiia bacterium]
MATEPTEQEQPGSPPLAPQRTAQWRRSLLARLPKLAYESWNIKEDFLLDEQWMAQDTLHADAVLAPLETLARDQDR